MSFGNPDAFYWLLIIPAMLLVQWLSHRRAMARIAEAGDAEVLGRLAPSVSVTRRVTIYVLRILGVALLVTTLARPRTGGTAVQVNKLGVDMVVAADISKSMLAQDLRPSRLKAVEIQLRELFKKLAGDRVALVAFAGVAFPQCPLTADYGTLSVFLELLDPKQMPVGGTAIGRALEESIELLTQEKKRKALEEQGLPVKKFKPARNRLVILFSDGEDHEGDPEAAAQKARDKDIRIFSVGVGTRAGEPIPKFHPDGKFMGYQNDKEGKYVYTRLEDATLRKVAELSQGHYFELKGAVPLADRLHAALMDLEREKLESEERDVYDEHFQYPLLGALFFLGLEAFLGERRRRRTRESK